VSVHERFVVVGNLRLHYREWGPASGFPVVLLHGGSAHAHWWDFFATAIADAYRVLAVDLRGHGESAHPAEPAYRIDDYAADLAGLIDALGLPRVDLIGHSLGAMVAAAYAGGAGSRLNSLVVVDSQLKISAAGSRYLVRLRNFPQPVYRDYDQAIQRFRLLPTRTQADDRVLAHVAAHGLRALPDGRWTLKFDREALAHLAPRDLTPVLRALDCPILLVRGSESSLLSSGALAALRDGAPHAEVAEIPGAHHHVMLDNPAAFGDVVRTFLDRVHAQPHPGVAASRGGIAP
jgi:pimeloyl-ACP methyl ester carboxylesterase